MTCGIGAGRRSRAKSTNLRQQRAEHYGRLCGYLLYLLYWCYQILTHLVDAGPPDGGEEEDKDDADGVDDSTEIESVCV